MNDFNKSDDILEAAALHFVRHRESSRLSTSGSDALENSADESNVRESSSLASSSQLDKWLNESTENHQAFTEVQETWDALDLLAGDFFPELEAFDKKVDLPETASSFESISTDQPLPTQLQSIDVFNVAWYRRPQTLWSSLAASLVAAIVLPLSYVGIPQSYSAAKGHQLIVSLHDGSSLQMSSNSNITLQEGWGARSVAMENGNVFFTVTPNPDKPFRVKTGDSAVTVLGTAFNIYRKGEHIEVTVETGKVNVKKPATADQHAINIDLTKNEKATIDQQGKFNVEKDVDLKQATGWRDGSFYFKQESLAQIIEKMGDYYENPIYIMSKNRRDLKLSGAFKTNDLDNFLTALQSISDIKIEKNTAGAVLLY